MGRPILVNLVPICWLSCNRLLDTSPVSTLETSHGIHPTTHDFGSFRRVNLILTSSLSFTHERVMLTSLIFTSSIGYSCSHKIPHEWYQDHFRVSTTVYSSPYLLKYLSQELNMRLELLWTDKSLSQKRGYS